MFSWISLAKGYVSFETDRLQTRFRSSTSGGWSREYTRFLGQGMVCRLPMCSVARYNEDDYRVVFSDVWVTLCIRFVFICCSTMEKNSPAAGAVRNVNHVPLDSETKVSGIHSGGLSPTAGLCFWGTGSPSWGEPVK